jgi:hypothetical protein
MFCPKCGVEYREGFNHCSDCDVALVETAPELPKPEYLEWVTVFEGDQNDAAVARATLENAGIEPIIRDEGLKNVFPSLGSVEVQVRAEDEDAALEALADAEEEGVLKSEDDASAEEDS